MSLNFAVEKLKLSAFEESAHKKLQHFIDKIPFIYRKSSDSRAFSRKKYRKVGAQKLVGNSRA